MPTGLMRCTAPPNCGISPSLAERAYMVGYDQIPWQTSVYLRNGELIAERDVADSGRLYVPLPVANQGEIMLCTGTLMERARPYHLTVELARGKLNQVRNQLEEWRALGLQIPPTVSQRLRTALEGLAKAVTSQSDPVLAARFAQAAIDAGVQAGDELVGAYIEQAIAVRRRSSSRLPTLLSVKLGQDVPAAPVDARLAEACNAAALPFVWRRIESVEGSYQWQEVDRQLAWMRQHRLKVFGGPLLQFDANWLPDWLCLWEGDFGNILSFVSDYIETTVDRYRGQVDAWVCAARPNLPASLQLDEEQRLQLTVQAIERVRTADPNPPVIVRFDQPWAEYMGRLALDLSPLHFADALVRSGLQIDGIGLEINMGYGPGGSNPRDRLEFCRLLDLWSYLGLPLHVALTFPGGAGPDPLAKSPARPLPNLYGGAASAEAQAAWIAHFLPLFLSKPAVDSVEWRETDDSQPHEFPHSGLLDAKGQPKPGLEAVRRLRQQYLA